MNSLYSMLEESLNINESKEDILSSNEEDKINIIIDKIKNLQSTIKHTIEDEAIHINALIEDLGKNIDEIDTNFYSNTSSVIEDLEYLIKESDWAKEDEESENSDNE